MSPAPRRPLTDDDERHGTPNAYGHHGCRCDQCRSGWAAHVRERNRRKAALRPTKPAPTIEDLFARYDAFVVRNENGCWGWSGATHSGGYAVLQFNKQVLYGHRVSYECRVGPIPDGLELDHLCSNRICTNPAHLEPVTHEENMRRASERQTTCRKAGHDWTDPANVKINSAGYRGCRLCQKAARRERYLREKAAAA